MPYNFLLLPVLFSYIIFRYSSFFKYNTQRRAKEVIIFETVVFSVPMIILAAFSNYVFKNSFNKEYIQLAKIFFDVYLPEVRFFYSIIISGLIILIFLVILEFMFWFIFKFILKDHNGFLKDAIIKYGDELDNFLLSASEQGKMIQLTLKNNKVYVGYLEVLPTPNKSVYLEITPLQSGVRNKDSQLIEFNTSYIEVFQDLSNQLELLDEIDDYESKDLIKINKLVDKINSIKVGFKKDEVYIFSTYDPVIQQYFKK